MEHSQFETAKIINEELTKLRELKSYCRNDNTHIYLGELDSWDEQFYMRIPPEIRDSILNYIIGLVNTKITELEQKFKDL